MRIDGRTQMVGILGYPIEYTLSPAMHNAAFNDLDMNWVYLPLRVPPGEVEGAVGGLSSLGFRGFNVTIPHKLEVVRFLRGLREEAVTLQAVNTVVNENGELWGYNTDVEGFRGFLVAEGIEAAGSSVLILGAGGAARAVALTLVEEGAARVFVMNRTQEKALQLVSLLKGVTAATEISVRTYDYDGSRVLKECDMVVNCTPLGNTRSDELPLEYGGFAAGKLAVDLKYGAQGSSFLEEASAHGAGSADGEGMLLYQAVASFRLWTGRTPPVDKMREALRRGLGAERR